jgi:hypothetical protein
MLVKRIFKGASRFVPMIFGLSDIMRLNINIMKNRRKKFCPYEK